MLRQVRLPPKSRKQEDSGAMIQMMIHLEEKVCDIDNDNMVGITYTTKTIATCIDRLPPL